MEGLINASIAVLLPNTIFFLVGGTVLGVILGAIPGVTGAMGIALLLPMTFYMTANNALTMMVSMYVGAIAGGLVTAILLRIPGEPSSIVTTFDGNPMARKGQPGRALGYATLAETLVPTLGRSTNVMSVSSSAAICVMPIVTVSPSRRCHSWVWR